MTVVFIIIGTITVVAAVAAMCLRNLVHCALSLAVTFAGLALLYLGLDAQFVGLAQLLVYVGAIAILIVFAILLTRGSEAPTESILSATWYVGIGIAAVVFVLIGVVILTSKALPPLQAAVPETSVRQLGDQLMTKYVLPLEVLGLLLTVALIGAMIVAMHDVPARKAEGNE